MSAPAGSYPHMGARNVMNEPPAQNPDVNQPPFQQTGVTGGAPQSPIQAASEGNTLGSTNANAPNNMSAPHPYYEPKTNTTGHPYSQPAANTTGHGYTSAGTANAQPATGGGAGAYGETAGKGVHGAFKGIHGVGEMIRGNVMSAVDRALGNQESAAKNTAIAEAGRQEMGGRGSAGSQPKNDPRF